MISGLTLAIALISTLICIVFFSYAFKHEAERRLVPLLAITLLVLLGTSLGVYAAVGRFSDWQSARVDDTRDFRLAAKITEARRALQAAPASIEAHRKLSNLYMQAGLFEDSDKVLDQALKITGPDAGLLGEKARALYYRDHRQISPAVQLTLEKAFAINQAEPSSRMLLAEHAFREKDYAAAIKEWEIILKAHSAPGREQVLQRAIENAKEKLAQTK